MTEQSEGNEDIMEESEKIVLEIIQVFYPEWVRCQKEKYIGLEGYELYKQMLLDVFGYDLDRVAMEKERALDLSGMERKLEITRLKGELKKEEKKKKGKSK